MRVALQHGEVGIEALHACLWICGRFLALLYAGPTSLAGLALLAGSEASHLAPQALYTAGSI